MSGSPAREELDSLKCQLEEVRRECARLRAENAQFRQLLGSQSHRKTSTNDVSSVVCRPERPTEPLVTEQSSVEERIALFRNLFRGREDVYPIWWSNQRTGAKGYAPAVKGGWVRRSSGVPLVPTDYLPLTDDVFREHLSGQQSIGIYPLLRDATCWFLACDFDGKQDPAPPTGAQHTGHRNPTSYSQADTPTWALDAVAYQTTCEHHGIPAYLERSRSGQGGHVWIFFASPVPAATARHLGFSLLRESMAVRGELTLESYDRFFPSQDTLPKGGFGNLIALPLQPLSRRHGHTEFVDKALCSWSDQWDFLSRIQRLSATHVASLSMTLTPISVGPGSATAVASPNRDTQALPATITGTLGATLVVYKTGLPAWFMSQLRHLASLHNPVFYERQKLRLSTYRTPRFIRCYEEDPGSLVLPRGVLEEMRVAVTTTGSKLAIQDLRPHVARQTFPFTGTLTPIQQAAIRPFLHHDYGVLVAPPGAGKTVMACAIAAQRSVPTLILVHRKPLMEQWRMQIASLLGVARADIGEISGLTRRRTGKIDLAMVQSLRNLSEDEPLYREYGLLIVDECHHVPAFNFESIMKRVAVQAVLGLTATPYRRDGLQDLIVMQCGPVRHKMSSRSTAASGELTLEVLVRNTGFTRPADLTESIQDVFHALGQNDARLRLVTEDVVRAVRENRRCLILSERKEHCRLLSEHLAAKGVMPLIIDGSVKKSVREAILEEVRILPPEKEFVLIATGQYLGEGFDCPQADTLFLSFPISFKGKLIQYLGRIMRPYPGKTVAHVYDYADVSVPVLRQMHLRRLKTYTLLGAHGMDRPSDQGTLSFS